MHRAAIQKIWMLQPKILIVVQSRGQGKQHSYISSSRASGYSCICSSRASGCLSIPMTCPSETLRTTVPWCLGLLEQMVFLCCLPMLVLRRRCTSGGPHVVPCPTAAAPAGQRARAQFEEIHVSMESGSTPSASGMNSEASSFLSFQKRWLALLIWTQLQSRYSFRYLLGYMALGVCQNMSLARNSKARKRVYRHCFLF